MTKSRRREGDETWARLKEWSRGPKASERLAGLILRADGYTSIDPSHPLGGKDALKDIVSKKDDKTWVCACYFPRGQVSFSQIKKKFSGDFQGALAHISDGFVFVTNQEISIGERDELRRLHAERDQEIYHIERVANLLNSPACYGIRLEYLDIELTKEEQLSYFAERDKGVLSLKEAVDELIQSFKSQQAIPVSELQEFGSLLDRIVGNDDFVTLFGNSPIDRLKVPIKEIQEFRKILESIVGQNLGIFVGDLPINRLSVPLSELREFKTLLEEIVGPGDSLFGGTSLVVSTSQARFGGPPIRGLHVPLHELREYEEILDRIVRKKDDLERGTTHEK